MSRLTSLIRLLGSADKVLVALRGMQNKGVQDNSDHLKLAGEWLLRAQSVHNDGGFAHSYSLYGGWGKSYPETTGYIIPSLLALANYLKDDRYNAAALKAGLWLLDIQQEDGAFLDLSGRRQVFDTGQILEGLVSLHDLTKDRTFLTASVRAANFLRGSQDVAGTWTRNSYNYQPHTYYTRVAANLLKVYRVTGGDDLRFAAEKMLRWAVNQQMPNGYFRYMEFESGSLPYLHTIIYVLEGLLESDKILNEQWMREALCRTVEALIDLSASEGPVLYGQYDERWRYPKKERCVTGLAQWAGLLVDVAPLMKGELCLRYAEEVADYLKAKQCQATRPDLRGALSGSIPLWGSYFKFSFNNWTAKFFIDALLKTEMARIRIPLISSVSAGLD
jgi:hypothetical protein